MKDTDYRFIIGIKDFNDRNSKNFEKNNNEDFEKDSNKNEIIK